MNRRSFIASLVALPAAIKGLFCDPAPLPAAEVPLGPELREYFAAEEIEIGDVVYLHHGVATVCRQDGTEVLGVAVEKSEGAKIFVI